MKHGICTTNHLGRFPVQFLTFRLTLAKNGQRETGKMAPKVNPVKDFISGGVGGVCLVVAGHPFDTLKVSEDENLCSKISGSDHFSNITYFEPSHRADKTILVPNFEGSAIPSQ